MLFRSTNIGPIPIHKLDLFCCLLFDNFTITVMITSIIGRPGDNGKNSGLENLQREIAILKKVDHPYVVRLFEVCNRQKEL